MGPRRALGLQPGVVIVRGVYWIHYKLTVLILCILAAIIAARQCFGSPIDCVGKTVSLNTYCWSSRTYTVDRAFQNTRKPYTESDIDRRRYHKGYQYYHLVLLLQAFGFLLPFLLWRWFEGKLMHQLTWRSKDPFLHPEVRAKKKKQLTTYLQDHMRRNSFYLFFYLVSETLCFINGIVQLVLANYFLDGVFNNFPQELLGILLSGKEDRTDPLQLAFPSTTWCHYEKPGSAETLDLPCFFPYNAFNELTCFGVWYWTAALTVVTAISILYHFLELASPQLRLFALKRQSRLLDRACLEKVLLDAGLGDWFLLLLLCRNTDPVQLEDAFRTLADDLGKSPLENILVCYPTRQVVDQIQRSSPLL